MCLLLTKPLVLQAKQLQVALSTHIVCGVKFASAVHNEVTSPFP